MQKFKKMSIRSQFLVLAISSIIIVMIIIFVNYSYSASGIKKNTNNNIVFFSSQIQQSVNTRSDVYNRVLGFVAFNSIIQEFMTETDRTKWLEQSIEVDKFLNNIRIFQDGIIDIIMVDKNGVPYGLRNSFRNTGTDALNMLTNSRSFYYSDIMQLKYDNRYYDCFILSTYIYSINPKMSSQIIGKIGLVIDAKRLGIENIENENLSMLEVYTLDRNGDIYSESNISSGLTHSDVQTLAKNPTGSYRTKLNGNEYMFYIGDITLTGGKVISLVKKDKLLSSVYDSRDMSIGMMFIAIILLSIPFTLIISNILQPINKLMKMMSIVKNGKFELLKSRVVVDGCAELSIMGTRFNEMLDQVDSLNKEVLNKQMRIYETELEKKQAELAFLQSQINPHFLYNTLDSIKGLASIKGVPEIRDMTGHLSMIFRYSLKSEEMVTLREELDIVKSYIVIQQIRFIDRFKVIFDVEDEVLDLLIFRMTMQPIVENAIYHGLEMLEKDGILRIAAYLDTEANLEIKISDNGMGMDAETLENVRKKLDMENTVASVVDNKRFRTGIGIGNVNNRIKLACGSQYGLKIDSTLGVGTAVTIKLLPRRHKDD